MNSKEKSLLWVARGGMELSWLYAWAAFTMNAILHRPFPLPAAMGTFILAALLTLFARGRGWRVIFILGTQVIGFSLAVSRIVYAFTDQLYPYLSREWLVAFMDQSRGPMEWIILSVILCFAILFWISGVTLARRSDAYFAVCNRFDLGVAAFLGLFLLKFLIFFKGGIHVQDPISEMLVFPFFIFSLLAIGIANSGSSVQKDFLSGFRGIGLIMSFSIIVLGFGAALVLLFLPYLTMAAEVGYGALKAVVGPLSPVVISILRFMFGPRRHMTDRGSQSSEGDGLDFGGMSEASWWTVLIEKIFSWSLISIVVLVSIIFFCIGVWYLLRWLLSRSAPSDVKRGKSFSFRIFIQRLWETLCFVRQWIIGSIKGYGNGAQLFGAVVRWGGRSGMPRFTSETPLEYALRLKNGFPFLNREIEIIVDAFNEEVYGETPLNSAEFKTAQVAWQKLRSPRYWPARLKFWFFADINPSLVYK